MSDVPVVPSPLYGLRTWTVVGESGRERLAGPHQGVVWPPAGAWLEAECGVGHAPPARGCDCGVHGWHPRRRSARRIVAARRELPGVVEASGAIEIHEDGFRSQRARPYAFLLVPGRNPWLVRRLAAAYGVPVVEASGPDAALEWCRARGLGLDEAVVARLLGTAGIDERRRARRRRARLDALRIAAALAAVALALGLGLAATGSPGERTLYGRTGEIHTHR